MHLLLLSLNYYPDQLGNAPILVGLAEGLVQRGHQVSVVCAFPHHERGAVDERYRGRVTAREERNGVKIYRAYIKEGEAGMRAKLLNYGSFTASSLWAALRYVKGVDLIFTPSPPLTLGLVDIALRARFKAPFVYNIQDLFPKVAIELGALQNPLAIKAFERLERLILTQADGLAVICEGFKRHAVALGAAPERVEVIPNFTDTELIKPQAQSAYRAEWGIADDEIVALFSGRMGYSQALGDVVEAWRLLAAEREALKLRLVMVGDGQARAETERALAGAEGVTFAPVQPRSSLGELLALADIGLAPLKAGLGGASVPSKLLGLMAAGRACVAQAEPETDTAELIERARCGLITPPGDPRALAEAIRRLALNPQERREMGARGREAVVARYSEGAVIEAYERAFNAVISRWTQP